MKDIKNYFKKYERHIGVGALIFGFIWDSITIGRADQIFGNMVIISYLLITAGVIFTMAVYDRNKETHPLFLSALLQFSFGNLAGGLLVIYGQSGSIKESLIFFIILLSFILGNELARSLHSKFNFRLGAWYFLLFAYLSVAIPVLIRKFGTWVFLLSALLSLFLVWLLLYFIRFISRKIFEENFRSIVLVVSSVFLIFNFLYFKNIIPPVPLSIVDIGIYHSLERIPSGDYLGLYEKPGLFGGFFRDTSADFRAGGGSAYCFSSVYAPVRLSTRIYHNWEFYNEERKEWQSITKISFPIAGGRKDGYRGYSVKSNLSEGKWRCSVETEKGQIIGRTDFKKIQGSPDLSERVF